MDLKIVFNNKTPDVVQYINDATFQAIKLDVQGGSKPSNLKALAGYITSLDFMFRGVVNKASASFKSLSIVDSQYGDIHADAVKTTWNCVVDKTATVIYDVRKDTFVEHLYVADIQGGNKKDMQFKWFDALFKPEAAELKNNLISVIVAVNKLDWNYKLFWDNRKGLIIHDLAGNVCDIDDIEDVEYVTILNLIRILVLRSMHLGVFFIDCEGISDKGVQVIYTLIKELYSNTFMFIYNCSLNYNIPKTNVVLPNYNIS